MTENSAYQRLARALKDQHRLKEVEGLLSWDEQVNLPEASAGFRAEQSALIASINHEKATSTELSELLDAAEAEEGRLSQEEQINVRDARKDFDRLSKLTPEFAAEKAALDSEGFHAWLHARKHSAYKEFEPVLRKRVELAKKEARLVGYDESDAYNYWLDQFDPGLTTDRLTPLFDRLSTELPPLAKEIIASAEHFLPATLEGFAEADQETFARSVIERMGFQFDRGRLDRAPHPFCSGCAFDTRLTTRYSVNQPLDSLFGAIHEAGHGLYEQGLSKDDVGLATGSAAGMAAHESQSRIWENQIARSRAFWDYWEPEYRAVFSENLADVPSDTLFRTINRVSRTQIRVDSDEVTYNLHIILRYEIERALFSGDLDVADAPDRWRELAQRFLGQAPENDREGILQDIHWAHGAFGYFPSYCLGNLLAAQMWDALRGDLPEWESDLREGEYHRILGWLRKRVHSVGKRQDLWSLAQSTSGKELGGDALIRYLNDRYLKLFQSG